MAQLVPVDAIITPSSMHSQLVQHINCNFIQ